MIRSAWQSSADKARAQLKENLIERQIHVSDPRIPQRFGEVAEAMWQGYHAAIAALASEELATKLKTIPNELLGFALEGVGMGLFELDTLDPQVYNRVQSFLASTEVAYQTMVYLGVGLMLVRRSLPLTPYLTQLNPIESWPVIDGYGFNYGIFYWRESIDGHTQPIMLSGYHRSIFDQGLGRSIWLIDAASVTRIPLTIAAFPVQRQGDLWGGVGYACASIGGVGGEILATLGHLAGVHLLELAKGAICAGQLRQKLKNLAGYTELAAEVLGNLARSQGINIDNSSWQHYREKLMM